MKKLMLDLCAGFGGQSEAFLRGGWDVLRIDNNPLLKEVNRMVIADVYQLEIFNNCDHVIDYVHAGPTCTEFSTGFSGPRGVHQRSGAAEPYEPTEGMRLVKRCKEIIDILKPKYWSIENVIGSIAFLSELLGEPRMIIGPYVYWGNFPLFEKPEDLPNKSKLDKRHSPLRLQHQAKCPIQLSQAFFDAMNKQKSILDFTV